MLVFSLLLLLTAAGASEDPQAPTFSWDRNQMSESGVPHLLIHFADGTTDVALLKPHNPIPVAENERASTVDPCIFMGHLRDEPDVSVALTGGCPFDDTFEVSFASNRLSQNVFIVNQGKVVVQNLPSFIDETDTEQNNNQWPDDLDSEAAEPLNSLLQAADRLSLPPSGFRIKLNTFSDKSHRDQFGQESLNVIRSTLAHAQNYLRYPSLTTTITLDVESHKEIDEAIAATQEDMLKVAKNHIYKKGLTADVNVFFCYDGNRAGVVGKSFTGSICNKWPIRKLAIVEWKDSDLFAGVVLAHELGHTLGMDHDFKSTNNDNKVPRTDSRGRTCTDVGGMMDYGETYSKWSTCSVEDFTKFYNAKQPFCLEAL